MKRLEKLVIQKNTKEEQEILQANKQSKPPKVRKMQSVVKVHEEDDKDDHNTTPPPQSGEPAKENQIDGMPLKIQNLNLAGKFLTISVFRRFREESY